MRPERAEAPSPGQRPGFLWSRPVALKGQKLSINRQYTKLLPLQGVLLNASIPRALPWARSFCPFRAYGEILLPQGVWGNPIASGRVGNSYYLMAYGKFLLPQGVWEIPIASGRVGNSYYLRACGKFLLPQGVWGKSIASRRMRNYFTSDFTLPSANLVSMMSPAFSCEAERMLLPSFSVML